MFFFQVQNSLSVAIFKKSFLITSAARQESTVGEIVNLMSVDAQKVKRKITLHSLPSRQQYCDPASLINTILSISPAVPPWGWKDGSGSQCANSSGFLHVAVVSTDRSSGIQRPSLSCHHSTSPNTLRWGQKGIFFFYLDLFFSSQYDAGMMLVGINVPIQKFEIWN